MDIIGLVNEYLQTRRAIPFWHLPLWVLVLSSVSGSEKLLLTLLSMPLVDRDVCAFAGSTTSPLPGRTLSGESLVFQRWQDATPAPSTFPAVD